MVKNKKEHKILKVINTNIDMLRFAFKQKHGRRYIVVKTIMSALNTALAVFYAILPGVIVNELSEQKRWNYLIFEVGILSLITVIDYFLNKQINFFLHKERNESELLLRSEFSYYLMGMDYETLESPEIQQLRRRAENALESVYGYVDSIAGFVSAVFNIFAMSTIIITLNPIIIILVVICASVNCVVAEKINYICYTLRKKADACDDRRDAISFMMNYIGYGKEIRLFNLRDFFIEKKEAVQREINELEFQSLKKSSVSGTCNMITSVIQQAIVYVYLIVKVVFYGLTLGNFTIYFNAVNRLSSALNATFGSYLELAQSSLNIQDYQKFVTTPSKMNNEDGVVPRFDKDSLIEFRNVSFRYPGSTRYAVKDLSIKIYGNERLCVVGKNGSGKSTFVKLLTGLYTPSEGEILLNGVNINEYNSIEYKKLFSPVFQDYCGYMLSVGESIILAGKPDAEKLNEVIRKSGLTSLIAKLPKGYDTQVGKAVDPEGFEPSGGEGQKLAIARALYDDSPIYLLDEPTASLDPIAEYEIYARFHETIHDKCAIVITHRLSAVQLSDKVAVFDEGHVAEYGTHLELYSKGGMYTEMFNIQAEFYRDEPHENTEGDAK